MDWQSEDAIREARLAIRRDSHFAWAHGLCGFYLLHARGEVEAAREEYLKAAEGNYASPTFQHHLGHPFFYRRDYTNAIKHYQKALDVDPRHQYGHYFAGRAHQAMGNIEKAINCFQRRAIQQTDLAKRPDEAKIRHDVTVFFQAFKDRA
jgi:tetratricopeptide (TPR) repeat protein